MGLNFTEVTFGDRELVTWEFAYCAAVTKLKKQMNQSNTKNFFVCFPDDPFFSNDSFIYKTLLLLTQVFILPFCKFEIIHNV